MQHRLNREQSCRRRGLRLPSARRRTHGLRLPPVSGGHTGSAFRRTTAGGTKPRRRAKGQGQGRGGEEEDDRPKGGPPTTGRTTGPRNPRTYRPKSADPAERGKRGRGSTSRAPPSQPVSEEGRRAATPAGEHPCNRTGAVTEPASPWRGATPQCGGGGDKRTPWEWGARSPEPREVTQRGAMASAPS